MSAFDVDKHLMMSSRRAMFATDRTTMICRPMVCVATQTPTKTYGSLTKEPRLVHQATTMVSCEPSYTVGLSHLLQRA
jgi:protein gp37